MGQVPARLVYTDDTATEQVIGVFQPQDPTQGNISTFTIDEESKNYRRVIIEGGPTLDDNMPTSLTEFNGSEPEIRVEIDSNLDGTWEQRLRVYPEESGTTDERGRYKNKNLWGFKKYYGEDDVDTGTVSTDLTDALQALLPTGYTARYPGDITAPSVSNYSYNGSRQQGFQELQEYYDHVIIFTDETDGSGNFYVDLQPVGYGGTQFSLTRGQDPLVYDYWKNSDLSEVVSKVTVIGTDSSNSKVEETVTASSPARNRFKRVHVDYTLTNTEAQSIANNLLQPDAVQQGAIESELRTQSTLNQSVGILDSDRGIDDVFTVVKQKDFLHEGVTYYSFEFEHESTQQQRRKWREHDNTRAKLYPEGQQDVGSQSFTGDTGSAPSDTATTGQVSDAPSDTAVNGQVSDAPSDTNVNGQVQNYNDADNVEVANITDSWSTTVDGNWTLVASISNVDNDSLYHFVGASISNGNPDFPGIALVRDNSFIEAYWSPNDVNDKDAGSLTGGTVGDSQYWGNQVIVTPNQFSGTSSDYSLYIYDKASGSSTSEGSLVVRALTHTHGDNFDTQDNNHPHGDNFDTQDNNHPHGDNFDTDDFQHGGSGDATGQHGASGTTDSKNVNVATEDKTDR